MQRHWLCLIVVMVTSSFCVVSGNDDLRCKDGSLCNNDETCCKARGSSYLCCPYQHAVCCSDMQHCCPLGTKCNLQKQSCDRTAEFLPWQSLVAREKDQVKSMESNGAGTQKLAGVGELASVLDTPDERANTMCPDRQHVCPGVQTCCLLPNQQWVCCPFAMATCCHDGYHCCPYGTRCDSTSTHCLHGSGAEILLAVLTQGKL